MKITKRQLRQIIREERDRLLQEAADPKIQAVADEVQAIVADEDRGSSIFDMVDKLIMAGFKNAEYISGMGMRYVQIPYMRGHIVIISKNSVEPHPETVYVGPYAIGYMGES